MSDSSYFLFIPHGHPEHVMVGPTLEHVVMRAKCLEYSVTDPAVRFYERGPDAVTVVLPSRYAVATPHRTWWVDRAFPHPIAVTFADCPRNFFSFTNGRLCGDNFGGRGPGDAHVYMLRDGAFEEVDRDEYSSVQDGPLEWIDAASEGA